MRKLLNIVLVVAVLAVPVQGTDVGKLRPVQAISIYMKDGNCVIETDTDDRGVGTSGMEALQNLKETTPGIIYLDTADYLLLGEGADGELEILRRELKPNLKLCRIKERIEPKQAAEYLRVHKNLPRLKVWKIYENIPILEHFEGRLKLLKNYEENG